jgi:ATP-dependent RNA helicase DDX55/SPB4
MPEFTFDQLPSPISEILEAKFGIDTPSPVQAAAIPLLLAANDVSAGAVTGSGKTLAFLLPIVARCVERAKKRVKKSSVEKASKIIGMRRRKGDEEDEEEAAVTASAFFAVIVLPVAELAEQVAAVARLLTSSLGITVACITGGAKRQGTLDGPVDILVATPGAGARACEKFGSRFRSEVQFLIFDEADRLLTSGFSEDMSVILRTMPKQRVTGIFSATQTKERDELAFFGLKNPVGVNVEVRSRSARSASGTGEGRMLAVPSTLSNFYQVTESPVERMAIFASFLRATQRQKVIVYCLTCAEVEYYFTLLRRAFQRGTVFSHRPVIRAIHGQADRAARVKALGAFAAVPEGVGAILLCTDVAARGLDIPAIEWTLQLDAPQDASTYLHRVGRAARMGAVGGSLLLLTEAEEPFVEILRGRGAVVSARPWHPLDIDPTADHALLDFCRAEQAVDRQLFEKGQHAFVSRLGAYSKSRMTFIFQAHKVDLRGTAEGMGLIRMPFVRGLPTEEEAAIASTKGVKDISHLSKKAQLREKKKEFRYAGDRVFSGQVLTGGENVDFAAMKFADPKLEADRMTKLEVRAAKKAARAAEGGSRKPKRAKREAPEWVAEIVKEQQQKRQRQQKRAAEEAAEQDEARQAILKALGMK